jgi:hypothetical protein
LSCFHLSVPDIGLLLFLHLGHLDLHLLSFSVSDLVLLNSVLVPFCNLIDDNLSSLLSGSSCSMNSIIFSLKALESLNLHHEVEFLLLFDVFVFQLLGFEELFISNSHNLRVENNLVHSFNVIKLVIQ